MDIRNLEIAEDELPRPEDELALVGAGSCGGFENTEEFKVVKFKEAMAGPDKE